MNRIFLSFLFIFAGCTHLSAQEQINILAWNLESDRGDSDTNDPEVIAEWLESFNGFDIFALSEVAEENAGKYIRAIARNEGAYFYYKVGQQEANDHLMLAWNSERYQELELIELNGDSEGEPDLKLGGSGRAPMAAKFKVKPNGPEFWVMVNHFHRTKSWKRRLQATGVRDWIAVQDIPVFAVGDYNFDWDIQTETGNQSFNLMFEDELATWVEPKEKVRTEDSHDSILDFVIVNKKALAWSPKSKIIQRDDDFFPANQKSDHRPVTARFTTSQETDEPGELTNGPSVAELLERIVAAQPTNDVEEKRLLMELDKLIDNSFENENRVQSRQLILEQIELMRRKMGMLEKLLKDDKGN